MTLVNPWFDKHPKRPFVRKILHSVIQLLNRQTILLLAILFVAGLAGALLNMSRLSSDLIHSQAIQSSALYAQAIKEARTLYSDNAVNRIKQIQGVKITPDYASIAGAIPLPATFLM
jgi:hypothetical protein